MRCTFLCYTTQQLYSKPPTHITRHVSPTTPDLPPHTDARILHSCSYIFIVSTNKQILRYERVDGVPLTATLYLPPGYDPKQHGPMPTILWAYPREFKTKDAAGQMRRSPYQFSGISSTDAKLWLARGFAILDGPSFPIIGEGDQEANDTYLEQLTSSARAAVKHVIEMGVADPAKVSVGGHSYGAFMVSGESRRVL
jgi:dipeptidyl aminopeptidase/acylaminoacyl peptidase